MPINDNLEAMAKQLYDYWFVQFDFPNEEGKPYKSSGGAMVWNEKLKREVPQGWNDCKIKDFMRIFTGKKDVSKAVPGNYKFFSCAPEPISSNEYIYDGYAVLVSGNGSYTGRVGFYKGKFDLYQRTYACVLDEDEHNISFFYYTLRYLFQPIYSGGKHGSSIPYIVLGDLADFRFAFNETICTKFVDAAKPMFDEQLLRQKEIEALTKQRDELLPLLMNGQASVNYHLSASTSISFDISVLFLNFTNGNSLYETIGLDYQCFALPLHSKENTYGTIQEDKRHIQQRQRQGDKHARERFLAFFYKCTSTVHQAAFGNAWCYRGYKGKDISESK
jgi:type I restriction enzyme S subunit